MKSHFTGKERDAESGNDYFEARYYASSMGRFLSPDWSAKEEPVPYARLDDPQTLNLYSYVQNNPLTNVDKDGHCAEAISCTLEFAGGGSFFGPVGTVVGAVVGAGVGIGITYFAAKAIAKHINTPKKAGTAGGERAGKNMTPKGKQEVIEENKKAHGGQATCENCGIATTPAKPSQPGVPTDPAQTTVDHIYPANPPNGGPKGDGSPSNGQVLCAECNGAKSNTVLTTPVVPQPPPPPPPKPQ